MSPVPSPNTTAVLAAIERAHDAHPSALLQQPHRVALRTELASAGLDLNAEDPALVVVAKMLADAEEFENDGEFAFIPLWSDLIREVSTHLPAVEVT